MEYHTVLTPHEMIRDPVFQLNAMIWLAQPCREMKSITPIFHDAGFAIYAVEPLLPIPPEVRLQADEAGVSIQQGVCPELVLHSKAERKFLYIECKASSFGAESSTSNQARGLLICAGPRAADILALDPSQISGSMVCYCLPEEHREALCDTLTSLTEELEGAGIGTGPSSAFGIEVGSASLDLRVSTQAQAFLGLAERSSFIVVDGENDPRPLYFLPYLPGEEQSNQEMLYCRRVLFERMHGIVLVAVGRSRIRTRTVFKSDEVLNDAMFGVYRLWENRSSKKHVKRQYNKFFASLRDAVGEFVPGAVSFKDGEGWAVAVGDAENQESVVDAISRFRCETIDLGDDSQGDLFDGA
ncbi:hypothetical protein JXA88_19145 [Candidatus Fermentibacteria bacterium]|nr:hypothetical protein [Candidatus Fermentibacteria bacterium]